MRPQRLQAGAAALALTSAGVLLSTALLGPSAAQPPLGPRSGLASWLPPYALDLQPSSAAVTTLLVGAYLMGGLAVALGLLAAQRGARTPGGWLVVAGCVGVLAVLVAPIGSADHLSYAAYGRIAVQGGDPYLQPPATWRGGHDPVTSAVEEPWRLAPSVYGPVATAAQAVTSLAGGESVRRTVWAWQLVCLAAWLAVAGLLHRRTRADPRAGARAAWLWVANPVLFGVLLMGAHVDVLGAALGLGALVLAGRRPWWAGVLLGLAVGVKLTFALLLPAVLYAMWRNRSGARPALLVVLGAALVLVAGYAAAGPHAFDQLERARRFVSLATPWRLLVDQAPGGAVRTVVQLAWPVLFVLLVAALARLVGRWPVRRHAPTVPGEQVVAGAQVAADAALAAVVLGTAYVMAAPYALPWYDAIAWAPLGLVAAGAVDALLLTRLVALALAYVPGRVVGMSPAVHDLTLGYRRQVAPWLLLALLVVVLALSAFREGRRPARPACLPRSPAGWRAWRRRPGSPSRSR